MGCGSGVQQKQGIDGSSGDVETEEEHVPSAAPRSPRREQAAVGEDSSDRGRSAKSGHELPADLPPPPPLPPRLRKPRTIPASEAAGGEWQWQESEEVWQPFSSDVQNVFRTAICLGMQRVVYCANGNSYVAHVHACVQMNRATGTERRVRFVPTTDSPKPAASDAAGARATAQFQWQLRNGAWVDYDEEENEYLSKAWKACENSVQYVARGYDYDIDFDNMMQVNVTTEQVRPIRIKKRASSHDGGRTHGHGGPSPSPGSQEGSAVPTRQRPVWSRSRSPSPEIPRRKSPPLRPGPSPEIHGRKSPSLRPGGSRSRSPPPEIPSRTNPFGHAGSRSRSPSPGAGADPDQKPNTSLPTRPSPHTSPSQPKIVLPRGVDWPESSAAKQASKDVFIELDNSLKAPLSDRKKIFRNACLRWHPDKNIDDEERATDVFQFLQTLKVWYLAA